MCVPKHTPSSYHPCIWRPPPWGSDNDCDDCHLSFSSSAPSSWEAHSKSTFFRSWKDDKRLISQKLYKYIILKPQGSQSQHNSQGSSPFFFWFQWGWICFLFYPNPWKPSSFSIKKKKKKRCLSPGSPPCLCIPLLSSRAGLRALAAPLRMQAQSPSLQTFRLFMVVNNFWIMKK